MSDVTGVSTDGTDQSANFNTNFFGTAASSPPKPGFQKIDIVNGGYNTSTQTGGYVIGNTPVLVPHGSSLDGTGLSAKFYANGSPTTLGPLFAVNTDGHGNLIVNSGASVGPGIGNARYSNLNISGFNIPAATSTDNLPAFEIGNSATFRAIQIQGLQSLLRQPNATYLDQVEVDRCTVGSQPDGSKYAVELAGAGRRGDGVRVNALHITTVNSTTMRGRGVNLALTQGATIRNCLNGDHQLYGCTGFSFTNFHGENGTIRYTACTGEHAFNTHWMRTGSQYGVIPLQLLADGGVGSAVGGNMWCHDNLWLYDESPAFVYDQVLNHASIASACGQVRMERNYVGYFLGGSNDPNDPTIAAPTSRFGIRIGDDTFDHYSHFASMSSTFYDGRWQISADIDQLGVSIQGLNPSTDYSKVVNSAGTWNLASGTYYFKVVRYIDRIRSIGRIGTAEFSAALTNGGPAVRLYLYEQGPAIVRLYIGTTSGSYDRYIDIAHISGRYLCVQGDHAMGYPSMSRTAGAPEAVAAIQPAGYSLRPGDTSTNSDAYGRVSVSSFVSAMPNAGGWRKGDTVTYTPAAGATKRGWLRITDCKSTNPQNTFGTDWVEMSL